MSNDDWINGIDNFYCENTLKDLFMKFFKQVGFPESQGSIIDMQDHIQKIFSEKHGISFIVIDEIRHISK